MNYPKHLQKDIQDTLLRSKDPKDNTWFGCSKEMIIEYFVEDDKTDRYIEERIEEYYLDLLQLGATELQAKASKKYLRDQTGV